jgi:cell division protein FtsN
VKRIVTTNPEAPPESSAERAAAEAPAPAPAAKAAPAPAVERPLRPWPAWQSAGANGRIVRIGAFGTRDQAKLGWRYMVQAYPAVSHLKATVVADRNSRGRHFYRFQIGTTSQAHSEVLCQRMERIRLSCAVVGLPWKPKGVER